MLDPNYIVGFVDGEGCFRISINQNGQRLPEVRLLFEIELREDDNNILEKIQKVLGCGNIYHLDYVRYEKWRPHVKYKVSNFSDIYNKIIPFFKQYPYKQRNFLASNNFAKRQKLSKLKST